MGIFAAPIPMAAAMAAQTAYRRFHQIMRFASPYPPESNMDTKNVF
jgi:hypothetical protein